MHISTIVPVYNNAPDPRACLSALMAASCPDSEIIVVDDASTDDTPLVAAEKGVHLLRLPRNAGLAALRIELLSLPAAALLGVIALNRGLYAFFARRRGLGFAAVCLPLHLLYYLYSGLSYLYVWIEVHLRGAASRPSRPVSWKQRCGGQGRTAADFSGPSECRGGSHRGELFYGTSTHVRSISDSRRWRPGGTDRGPRADQAQPPPARPREARQSGWPCPYRRVQGLLFRHGRVPLLHQSTGSQPDVARGSRR